MQKKILILSASIGTGHLQAARTIELALQRYAGDLIVHNEDALEFANPAFRSIYQKTYVELANNAPEVLGWIYNYTDRAWTTEEHGLAFERWNSGGVKRVLQDYQPDLIVCTHPLPADMTSWLLCKKSLKANHVVVLTDFDLTPLWLCHHYSLYFVALEETKQHLVRLGYSPDRVVVSGIPINPSFSITKDKTRMKSKYGLDPDLLTVLVSAGGAGLEMMEQVITSLKEVPNEMQVVALCGRNSELKERIEALASDGISPNLRIIAFGYVNDMDEFMTAADILIGKAGGLTSSEALAKGLPIIIVNPIPGQEERNADHLLERGAAIRCNNMPVLSYKIRNLLDDKARLQNMRKRALEFSHPQAAATIAKQLYKLAQADEDPSLRVHPHDHKCARFLPPILSSTDEAQYDALQ